MKTIPGLMAISMLGILTLLFAMTALLIQLLPALVVAAVVVAAYRAAPQRTTKTVMRPATPWMARRPTATMPAPHVNASGGGWVLLPVWVAPNPPMRPYIDAEVIGEVRRG